MTYIHLESVDSTNNYVKRNIGLLKPSSLVVADMQTNGRGRHGNTFFSPKNTGLYMTVLLKENPLMTLYTPSAAVAVLNSLSEFTDKEILIKWVNDLFYQNKKICGILCERMSFENESYILVGIGINLTTDVFPKELSCAGSLDIEIDKTSLSESIFNKLVSYNEKADNKYIIDTYRKHMFLLGKSIKFRINNIEFSGYVKELLDDCTINVQLDNGRILNLSSGEIYINYWGVTNG